MKKFLLLTVAVATASVAMAQWNHNLSKSPVIEQFMKTANKPMVMKSVNQEKAISLSQLKAEIKNTSRRASDQGIAGISQQVYTMNKYQGITNKNMFKEAKYYTTDDKVYLSLFNLGYMEGTIVKGNNRLSAYNADSVTFNLGTVAYEKEGVKLYYAGTTITATQKSISAARNNNATIGGYYFAEYNELYVPATGLDAFIAVYKDNETTPITETLIGHFDIQPAEELNKHISKATWTANQIGYDSKTEQPVTRPLEGGNAHVLLAEDGYYVSGLYPAQYGLENAWVFMEASEDGTQVTIGDNQYLGTVSFYTDETQKETTDVVFAPSSIKTDYSGWADNYETVLFVEEDQVTETTSLISDGLTTFTLYGYNDLDDFVGPWFSMTDIVLTITYELDGINDVKTVRVDPKVSYNMAGQRISDSYKGLVIKNGKKLIKK